MSKQVVRGWVVQVDNGDAEWETLGGHQSAHPSVKAMDATVWTTQPGARSFKRFSSRLMGGAKHRIRRATVTLQVED